MDPQVISANISPPLAQELTIREARISRWQDAVASLSCAGADRLDGATIVAEQHRIMALQALEQRRLSQVLRAIELDSNGQRELCEDCHQPLDPARLWVMPDATRCVSCQGKREQLVKPQRLHR